MASVHCIALLEHFIKMRASYFDTDFVSQMNLTASLHSLHRKRTQMMKIILLSCYILVIIARKY